MDSELSTEGKFNPFTVKHGSEMMDEGPWMAPWSDPEAWTQKETRYKQVTAVTVHTGTAGTAAGVDEPVLMLIGTQLW